MKRSSFSWMIGTAGCSALLILGGAIWISTPKPNGLPAPAQSNAAPTNSLATKPEKSFPATDLHPKDHPATQAPLSSSDFAARARSLDAVPAGEERTIAMRTIFRGWAAVAPRDALAWISTMPSESERDEARDFVCYRVAEDDPKLAFDLARQAAAGTGTPLVWDLAQQWAGADADAARDWALALPAGADRDQILSRVCYALSQSDPAEAGDIVSREITAGPAQDEAAMSVVHQWAIRDFDAASEWVAGFPESPLRSRVEAELTGIRDAADGHGAGR